MAHATHNLSLIVTSGPSGYALLDSGAGRKLERFGTVIVDRPEPQAMWQPGLPRTEWAKANAVFSASAEDEEKGRWRVDKPMPEAWPVEVEGVTMKLRLAGLWHLGLFPEQLPHWRWMVERLVAARAFSSPLAGDVARSAGGGRNASAVGGAPPPAAPSGHLPRVEPEARLRRVGGGKQKGGGK